MSRAIKFRGKRVDNGEWVYGNLLKLTHEERPIYYIIPSVTNGSWSNKKLMLKFISPCFEVISETVGQYTGLKDKNGKEIYEGDIVNLKGRKYIVEYWKGQLLVSWYLKSVRSGDTEYTELPVIGKGEVIGNIYENPELLEVENE